jgi:DNA-binding HxlR family transcriptional regulator
METDRLGTLLAETEIGACVETTARYSMTRSAPDSGRGRGAATGWPMTTALDLLGRRWAMRILWELRYGAVRATELQSRCDQMSTSVLYQRLRELADAGLIQQDESDAYLLTDLGLGLSESLNPIDDWARRWSRTAAARRLRNA